MIVTCEKCLTKFKLDPAKLGAGRNVRCASCSNVWFVEGTKPEPDQTIMPELNKIIPEKNATVTTNSKPQKRSVIKQLKVAAMILVMLNFSVFILLNKSIIGHAPIYDIVGNYNTHPIQISSYEIEPSIDKSTLVHVLFGIKNTSSKSLKAPNIRYKFYDSKAIEIAQKPKKIKLDLAPNKEFRFEENLKLNNKVARYLSVEIGNSWEMSAR